MKKKFNSQVQLSQVIPEQYVTRINITPIIILLHKAIKWCDDDKCVDEACDCYYLSLETLSYQSVSLMSYKVGM